MVHRFTVELVVRSWLRASPKALGRRRPEPLRSKGDHGWLAGVKSTSDAIYAAQTKKRKPTLILAPTILAKGIPFAEGKQEYRGVLFSEMEFSEALKFLKN